MSATARVALIGCGKQGQRRASVAPIYIACDPDIDAAYLTGCEIEPTRHYQDAIDRPEVDTVIVATPHNKLTEVAEYAIKAGKDVFIEKPVGQNLDDIIRLMMAATENPNYIGVGFSLRHHPAVQLLKTDCDRSEILYARMVYANQHTDGWRLDQGGVKLDLGIHLADLVNWLNLPKDMTSAEMKYREPGNLFRIEAIAKEEKYVAEGLGGHFGPESYTVVGKGKRATIQFEDIDIWKAEWKAFEERKSPSLIDAYDAMYTLEKM